VKRLAAGCVALLLVACAARAPVAPLPEAALLAHAQPGVATSAGMAATFGPARVQRFANGYQVWQYRLPRSGPHPAELVLLFDAGGVLRKLRLREPSALDAVLAAPST
jgi:hypothetical protein